MEAIRCIETRRSIRKFKAEQVPHETMQEIVAAAAYAPSWKNTQVTRYAVVEDPQIKARIAEEATLGFEHNSGIIKNCAALVVVNMVHGRSDCTDKKERVCTKFERVPRQFTFGWSEL